jgi:hypothetical protein
VLIFCKLFNFQLSHKSGSPNFRQNAWMILFLPLSWNFYASDLYLQEIGVQKIFTIFCRIYFVIWQHPVFLQMSMIKFKLLNDFKSQNRKHIVASCIRSQRLCIFGKFNMINCSKYQYPLWGMNGRLLCLGKIRAFSW